MKYKKRHLLTVAAALLLSLSHYVYGQQMPPACARLIKSYELCTRDYIAAEARASMLSGEREEQRSQIDPKHFELELKASIKKNGTQAAAASCASEQKKNEIAHAMTNIASVTAFMGGDPQRCMQTILQIR